MFAVGGGYDNIDIIFACGIFFCSTLDDHCL